MELSNAVTVLIARMESHPEDFESYGPRRGKFVGTADSLYGLCGLDTEKKNAFWFLSDADKQALIEAWKKFHCKQHEKEVMEMIFDEGYDERQREQEAQMQAMKQRMYQQQMAAQQIKAGSISPLHNNAAQSGYQGLLGSVGNAFQGLIK